MLGMAQQSAAAAAASRPVARPMGPAASLASSTTSLAPAAFAPPPPPPTAAPKQGLLRRAWAASPGCVPLRRLPVFNMKADGASPGGGGGGGGGGGWVQRWWREDDDGPSRPAKFALGVILALTLLMAVWRQFTKVSICLISSPLWTP